jgi:hypothetical protein
MTWKLHTHSGSHPKPNPPLSQRPISADFDRAIHPEVVARGKLQLMCRQHIEELLQHDDESLVDMRLCGINVSDEVCESVVSAAQLHNLKNACVSLVAHEALVSESDY